MQELGVTAGGIGVYIAPVHGKVEVDTGAGNLSGTVISALPLCHNA